MNKQEYILSVLGTPWVNRETDCWWLVKDYYYNVMGYTLKSVKGYAGNVEFESLWGDNINTEWVELPRYKDGAMITLYDAQGRAVHVGVCVGNREVFHSRGNVNNPGKAEISKLTALLKVYNKATYHYPKGF